MACLLTCVVPMSLNYDVAEIFLPDVLFSGPVSIAVNECIMEGYPPVPNGYVRAGSRSATVCK